jgi:hypothetical protein
MKDALNIDHPYEEPYILLHALVEISSPQTLKLVGYIEHRMVIVLIDSVITHNLIHYHIANKTLCYIHVINKFQIMIADEGSMKCDGNCDNVKLQMGDYFLKMNMFTIKMGGCHFWCNIVENIECHNMDFL